MTAPQVFSKAVHDPAVPNHHVLAPAAVRRRISFVTIFALAQWVDLLPGQGEIAAVKGAGFAGTGALAIPTVINLGSDVTVEGPITEDQSAVRDQIVDWGAECHMELIKGSGAHEIRVPAGGIILARTPPPYRFTIREARLAASKSAAVVVGKGLDSEYVAHWVELAAAESVPCFVVVGHNTDLGPASRGNDVYLILEPGRILSAGVLLSEQLLELRDKTNAKAVIALDPRYGLLTSSRGTDDVLQLLPPIRPVDLGQDGCADALVGGFVSAFVRAPEAIRMERSMVAGMALATRRALGLSVVSGWSDLFKFYKSHRGSAIRTITPASLMSQADVSRDSGTLAEDKVTAHAVRDARPQSEVPHNPETSHDRQ